MQWAHFLFGHFDGYGMCVIQSRNVDLMLSEQSVQYLHELGKHHQKQEVIKTKFPMEEVIAYSFLKPTTDEHGRASMLNYTVLVRYDDVFTDYEQKVKLHCAAHFDEPPKKLEPLQIKT